MRYIKKELPKKQGVLFFVALAEELLVPGKSQLHYVQRE